MSGQKKPSLKGASLSLDLLPDASPLTIYCSTTEPTAEEAEQDRIIRARLNELKKSHFVGASTASSSDALAERLARLKEEPLKDYSKDVLRPRPVKSDAVAVDDLMAQMAVECSVDDKCKEEGSDEIIARRLEKLKEERLSLEQEGKIASTQMEKGSQGKEKKKSEDEESSDRMEEEESDDVDEELSSVVSGSESVSSGDDERADRLIEQIMAEQRLEEQEQQQSDLK